MEGRGPGRDAGGSSREWQRRICEDMADLLLNERVKITIGDATTDAFVQDVLRQNNFMTKGNEYQELQGGQRNDCVCALSG